jgi:hypothetical protein
MRLAKPLILVAGDLIALTAFVLVGQADHNTVNLASPLLGALPNVLSLAVPWLVIGWILGAFPRDNFQLQPFLARSLVAWIAAVPVGLVVRMLWLGRGGIPIMFLLVTLAAGGLFLLGWRLVYGLIFRSRPDRTSSGPQPTAP